LKKFSYPDQRGFFEELFNEVKYPAEWGIGQPKQISVSSSRANVVRGLHRSQYFKLVTCVRGRIIDVMVDLDESSPTYKKWSFAELSADKPSQVFIPPRFGHGFISLEDDSTVCYAQGGSFDPINEMDVNIFDPAIGIDLAQLKKDDLIISDKDKNAPMLEESMRRFKERQAAAAAQK
jgi:dTDP-4-dehydrorhamnose 3,5-epimerase